MTGARDGGASQLALFGERALLVRPRIHREPICTVLCEMANPRLADAKPYGGRSLRHSPVLVQLAQPSHEDHLDSGACELSRNCGGLRLESFSRCDVIELHLRHPHSVFRKSTRSAFWLSERCSANSRS